MARRKGRVGAPVGIVMAVGAIAALFWNEGRSVDRIKTIDTGRDAVTEGDPGRVDASLQGKLVHLVGPATGGDIADTVFRIELTALRLDRRIDMYQWVETKKGRDGHTEYEYRKAWRNERVTGFDDNRYVNPEMPYRDQTFYPAEARLGAYRLSRALLDDLDAGLAVIPSPIDLPKVGPLRLEGERLYSGDPKQQDIGDLRIAFNAAPEQTVSVLAGMAGGELLAFRTEHGDLAMIEPGAMNADAMLALAETRNAYLTWGIRLAGTAAIFFGLFLLLSSAVSWIPFAQGLARAGAALIAIVLAVPIALSVIAFAWLWFRPLWAIGLFCVAALGPIFLVLRGRRANRAPAMAHAMPPPPPPPPR
ncbi:MAG: TMEM43 family protein [Alphaproteobacteria bacterium]